MSAAGALPAPYRGLAPYGDGEADAALFFGREHDTSVVTANLLASRLTILYGPSGAGKTSLLRAGVARRIRGLTARRGASRPDGAVVVFASWAGDSLRDLEAAVAAEVRERVGRSLPGPPDGATLADVLDHWTNVLDGELFIVLDQVEEHFVYTARADGAGALVDQLAEVIVRPRLRTHVLLSVRDDAFAQLDVLRGAVPGLFTNVVRLDRLDRAGGRAAIVGPADAFNVAAPPDDRVAIEPELVDRVLDQTAAVEGGVEAPYLQLVMERVWDEERRRDSHELRVSTLDELGGAATIVRDHLGRTLGLLDDGEQELVARMFEHLVTPSGSKIAHRASDLAQFAGATPRLTAGLLERLAQARILRALDDDGDGSYEIFHDVLADAVAGWCRARALEQARRAAERHKRRLVATIAASAAALLVMAAVTAFALTERRSARSQERSAEARALTAAALGDLTVDPELSLLLARRAAALRTSPQIESALRQALIASRVRAASALGAPVVDAAFTGANAAVAVTAAGRVMVVAPSGAVRRSFETGGGRGLVAPTGTSVLVYGRGRPARLFEVGDGRVVQLRTRPVTGAVFSPDGRLLFTTSAGTRAQLWETRSGRELQAFDVTSAPVASAVSADGSLAAVAERGNTVEVYVRAGGRRLTTMRVPAPATRLAFSPDGRLLAIATAADAVTVRDARTGRAVASEAGHVLDITGVAFSSDGKLLATSSLDGTARVYAVDGGLVSVLVGHGQPVTSIVFSPDGSRVATTSSDGTARIWRAVNGNPVAVLAGHDGAVDSVAFSRDGRRVLTAAADGLLRFWDAEPEPALEVVRRQTAPVTDALPAGSRIVSAPPGVTGIAVSPDGSRVALAEGRRVDVRQTTGDKAVASFVVPATVTGVALAADGEVAVACVDGVVRLPSADGTSRVLRAGGAALTRVAFSGDGRLVAAGSTDHAAYVWSVAGGAPRVFRGHTDVVNSVRFARTGALLVTASRDHHVRIWDVETGRTIHVLSAHFGAVADAGFSPDGRFVVTAGPGKAGLFEARTGRLLFYLAGHRGPLTDASFAADGRTIVTSGSDGTIRAYRCDVCAPQADLERLADRRLGATRRQLTDAELQQLGL